MGIEKLLIHFCLIIKYAHLIISKYLHWEVITRMYHFFKKSITLDNVYIDANSSLLLVSGNLNLRKSTTRGQNTKLLTNFYLRTVAENFSLFLTLMRISRNYNINHKWIPPVRTFQFGGSWLGRDGRMQKKIIIESNITSYFKWATWHTINVSDFGIVVENCSQ